MGGDTAALEERLCSYLGRRYCVFAGRCTAAIFASLRASGIRGGRVALSAVSNPAPANAILYAGLEPAFCDVDLESFNIDLGSLSEVVESAGDVRAVLAVHLYGQPAPIDGIMELARARGLFVVEDLAQAMGATYKGRKVGTFGDVSVVSFGHTKIVDVGGGGAALTDDPGLAQRIRAELDALPSADERSTRLMEEYREVYYSLKRLAEVNPDLNELFVPLPGIYKGMYLFRGSDDRAAQAALKLEGIDRSIAVRRANALSYEAGLTHPRIVHARYDPEGVFWRYSFLVNVRDPRVVSERMRAMGFDISNWYPPLHRWYRSGRMRPAGALPKAEYLGSHIFNLWTDPSQSAQRVAQTVRAMLQVLDGLADWE